MLPFDAMRGDSGKVNVLRVEIIGNCEKKILYEHVSLLYGYQDRAC
jgi:hypothetical protein